MKHELRWRAEAIAKLVKLTTEAKEWRMEYGNEETPRPQIILVKDEGIYLISNKIYPKGKSPSSEKEVFYADEYNPEVVSDRGDLWDLTHEVSGDDFGYYIDIDPIEHKLKLFKEVELASYDFVLTMDFDQGPDRDELELTYGFKLHKKHVV